MTNGSLETIAIAGTKLIPTRIALGTWAIGGWMWGGSDRCGIDPYDPQCS